MSNDKGKVTDKAGEIARNIWLAGVGAYGRAVEDAEKMLEKAMEPPKLFRDLVKAGAALEEEARGALQGSASARHSVEERINRVRENFHMQRPARYEDIAALQKQVDRLSRKVAALSRALEGGDRSTRASSKSAPKSRKPAPRKQPATRKPARPARTTTRKRPPAAKRQS